MIVLLGGSDQKLHYYETPLTSSSGLTYRCSLSGHENAITKIVAFTINK